MKAHIKMEKNMSPLNKALPWIAGLFTVVATTTFADYKSTPQKNSFEQGQKIIKAQMQPGYNGPARIDVRSSWDVFATGSFIYWQLSQDSMQVAFSDAAASVPLASTQMNGSQIPMDFGYKPGFKVGLGLSFDHDDWDSLAEYTRIHTSNSTSFQGGSLLNPFYPTWGNPFVVPTNAYNNGFENWACNLDIIDLDLGRPFYSGTNLTFRPAFGLRSVFITQNVHAHYLNTTFTSAAAPIEAPGVMDVYNRNRSWSIGPSAGLSSNWIFGYGFRLFGNAKGDLIYTKYKIQTKTTFIATQAVASAPPITVGQNIFAISSESVAALRTHLEMALGLGWGSYFDNNNWHVDLSAAYEIHTFFDQNMLGYFPNGSMPARSLAPMGNLYAQGMTITARFDF